MLLEGDSDLAGIAVPDHVGKGFLCDADQAVFDFPGNQKAHVVVYENRAEGKTVGQAADRILQIHGIIVQVVYAAADAVHGGIEGIVQMIQHGVQLRLTVHRPGGAQQQDGTGQDMAHIVVDLPCDPVSLPEGRGIDLVVLLFYKSLVLFCQEELILPAVVLTLPVLQAEPFILCRMDL